MRARRFIALFVLLPALLGCNASPTEPTFGEADVKFLFYGNSLTYANDMPAMMLTIATQQGLSVDAVMYAQGNYGLIDHWNDGSQGAIETLDPDVVILQQGPSSLPQNQELLREWTLLWEDPIKAVGARPALMMVWPDATRFHAFPDVRDSYLAAAEAIGGDFLPVGEVIRRLLPIPGISPLSADGFHPSLVGSFAQALTILRCYFPDVTDDLPSSFTAPPGTGFPSFDLDASTVRTIANLVDEVAEEWGY